MEVEKEFRRISVAEAQAAFTQQNLKPMPGVSLSDRVACPIMACALNAGFQITGPLNQLANAAAYLGLTLPYANGLIEGFDGDKPPQNARPHTESGLGYRDGRAIRAAMERSTILRMLEKLIDD